MVGIQYPGTNLWVSRHGFNPTANIEDAIAFESRSEADAFLADPANGFSVVMKTPARSLKTNAEFLDYENQR